ncbi:hypothetical protein FRB98_001747 [Tulasnella sp. 332]|nr:hypothetical protein FRB98_001747 [Tulasnella sp. 332]
MARLAWTRRQERPRSRITSLLTHVIQLALATTTVRAAQPTYPGDPMNFKVVGDAGISAQQAFLGTADRIYVIDKTENNPVQVNGHPAWAVEYNINTDTYRTMDVVSNTFCAGGNVLGNGTWINVGGNPAIQWGGVNTPNDGVSGPYFDADGGKAIRILQPCDDESCNWIDDPANYMTTARWYPTLETLQDGSIIIIGGDTYGGYVNSPASQNNPTYEFYPSRGDPIDLQILSDTLPANLYPFAFLMPSGNLFVQANWAAEIFDWQNNTEFRIGDIPHSVRTYPGSAANAMLPLTPENGWTATIIFCGGTNLQPDQWTTNWDIAQYPADATCVKITPDVSQQWIDEGESLPDGRSMGMFVILPDGTMLLTNGVKTGTAGYGNDTWVAGGHSYGANPLYQGLIYDPSQPVGSRMSSEGMGKLNVEKMYHSTCLLVPDGSVWCSGSNPNPDYVSPKSGAVYPTQTAVERFFPAYYNKTRPDPQNLPTTLGYGGPAWSISLTAADLLGSMDNLNNTKVVLLRPGFCTHAINMGQRYVQLNSTYTGNSDGSAVLNVQQLPPNPSILAPGPAYLFVVVDGVPSVGAPVMVGSGMGNQTIGAVTDLPASFIQQVTTNSSSSSSSATTAKSGAVGGAQVGRMTWVPSLALGAVGLLAMI